MVDEPYNDYRDRIDQAAADLLRGAETALTALSAEEFAALRARVRSQDGGVAAKNLAAQALRTHLRQTEIRSEAAAAPTPTPADERKRRALEALHRTLGTTNAPERNHDA